MYNKVNGDIPKQEWRRIGLMNTESGSISKEYCNLLHGVKVADLCLDFLLFADINDTSFKNLYYAAILHSLNEASLVNKDVERRSQFTEEEIILIDEYSKYSGLLSMNTELSDEIFELIQEINLRNKRKYDFKHNTRYCKEHIEYDVLQLCNNYYKYESWNENSLTNQKSDILEQMKNEVQYCSKTLFKQFEKMLCN